MSDTERTYRNKDQEKFLGLIVENPKVNANTAILFRAAACLGNVDFFGTIGPKFVDCHGNVTKSQRLVPTFNFESFYDFLDHKPMCCEVIGVELDDRAKDLESFDWPKRCVIVLGNETNGLTKEARNGCNKLIKLPNPRLLSLNVSTCGSMVLWDHYLKNIKS